MKDAVRDLSKRSAVARDSAETEEATKNSVILPFIRALGFDVFDLQQVVPEYNADVGVKKGEKVDYALKIDGRIVILIEAKPISVPLSEAQYNQLYRYFSVTEAQIAILTNGAEAWFFSDIDDKNKMDKRPFFRFDFAAFDDEDLKELSKFHRSAFDIENILQSAASLKYTTAAQKIIADEMDAPSDDLVRLVARQIHDGMVTKGVIDMLRPCIRSAFQQIVRGEIQEKFQTVLSTPDHVEEKEEHFDPDAETDGIFTTEEEMKAFMIVQAISSEMVEASRISIRDTKSYCGVLFDNNNRKPICRFWFNGKSVKHLGLFDGQKKETKSVIQKPEDVYLFKSQIQDAVRRYVDG